MDTFVTYEALKEALPDLRRRYHDYIPRLYNRAQFRPELDGVSIEPSRDYKQFVAIVNIYILEHVGTARWPRTNWIHLCYGIFPTGGACNIMAPQFSYMGAESAYSQPPSEWASAIRERLAEEAAKARIIARAKAIHEELVAAVWAPERLAARLKEGGWDLVDAC